MFLKLSPMIVLGLLIVVIALRVAGVIDATTSSLLSLGLATIAIVFAIIGTIRRRRAR